MSYKSHGMKKKSLSVLTGTEELYAYVLVYMCH